MIADLPPFTSSTPLLDGLLRDGLAYLGGSSGTHVFGRLDGEVVLFGSAWSQAEREETESRLRLAFPDNRKDRSDL